MWVLTNALARLNRASLMQFIVSADGYPAGVINAYTTIGSAADGAVADAAAAVAYADAYAAGTDDADRNKHIDASIADLAARLSVNAEV